MTHAVYIPSACRTVKWVSVSRRYFWNSSVGLSSQRLFYYKLLNVACKRNWRLFREEHFQMCSNQQHEPTKAEVKPNAVHLWRCRTLPQNAVSIKSNTLGMWLSTNLGLLLLSSYSLLLSNAVSIKSNALGMWLSTSLRLLLFSSYSWLLSNYVFLSKDPRLERERERECVCVWVGGPSILTTINPNL